ncbi:hypothetical protein SLE2022_104000 [Rubroshorea leprosula]
MEVDNQNPSAIRRLLANKALVADLNRKRKLHAEQLGLPISKHQCGNGNLLSKPHSMFHGNLEIEDSSSCTSKVKAEGGAIDDGSESGSAKDSNSFGGGYDSVISVHAGAKFEADNVKISQYDRASSSASGWGSSSLDSCCSSDGRTIIERNIDEDQEMSSAAPGELEPANLADILNRAENLDEALLEYESHIDYIYSGYGNYIIEQYQDKEIEEIPQTSHANANANAYILSSGRWTVNQGAQQSTQKPTIDQEFEHYFSTLML